MFQGAGMLLRVCSPQIWLAQAPVNPGIDTPEQAALVFSGPQFFVALISGLVLAFAFQLLLTNLSVATGISYLGHQSDSDADEHESSSMGNTIRKIGFAVGLWTLVTVSLSLFLACLLAVKLSLVASWSLGVITAVVIWAAYFSLLVWVSSTTVGSLIGSVVNSATSGFQAIVGTAAAALGGKAVNDQVVATAEAAAAAVRRELGSAVDPESIRENIENYLSALRPPELDLSNIRSQFEQLLNDPELKSIASTEGLRNINRQTFVDLVSSRTDFSKRDVNRIVDQLETVWRQVVNTPKQRDVNAELLEYLRSAQPGELKSDQLSTKLDELIAETRKQSQATQDTAKKSPSLVDRAVQFGTSTLMGAVMGRSDLSDLDVEKILGQLQKLGGKISDQASQVADRTPALPFSTIKADAENYLLNAYPWHLNRETLNLEFKDVIYDPQADPGTVRRQLEQLDRGYFVDVLNRRGDLPAIRVSEIADQLEAIRQEVLTTVQTVEAEEQSQDLRSRIENYLRSTDKAELNPEGIERDFKVLLSDPEAGSEALRDRLSRFDRDTLVQFLNQRQDLSQEEVAQIVDQLEGTRDRVLSDAESLQEQAKSEAAALRLRVESYLRNTNKAELNPEGIKRDLQTLLDDPQAGASALRARLSQVDRDTLVQLLSQRQDLSEEQVNQIIDQVQSVWNNTLHAPQALVGKAKEQYDQTTSTIAEYLRNTNREELDPEGIQRDLQTLLDDPKAGALALRARLSQVDRETLVKLLSQRQDLSEEQVNQIIDQVQEAIRSIVRAPRRWATRAQTQVQDFQTNLESYLRNTDKEELNPEQIKRDLQLLLNDPRAGLSSLGDRVSQFDRSTFVALLAQRPDMTEEEANRIADQIESTYQQFVEQVRNVQRQIQSVIDNIFARIRNYLNSLERPELNYDGIKRDVRQLFDDPQAGFDALRDRLGHFNRDTLVAVLSSREDISEADVNRVIDQIEGVRTNVLQRAERLGESARRRMEEVKLQAQRQAEETRKAAATAAWWLFATAFVSAATAALGGAVAVYI